MTASLHAGQTFRKQNDWGDLSDSEYGRLRSEVEADLLSIPGDADTVVLFDGHRLVIGLSGASRPPRRGRRSST